MTPEAFLTTQSEFPRGFWLHGDAWTAFAGATLVLDPGGAEDRIMELRARADDCGLDPEARWFGGLAFRADGALADEWGAFRAGRFVLPATELRSRAGRQDLICRAGSEATAEQLLQRLVPRMADEPNAPPPAGEPAEVVGTDSWGWAGAVEEIIRAVAVADVTKVVLARTLDVGTPADPLVVLRRLREENPASTIFYFEPGPGSVFLGAAPEILVALDGDGFRTTAVAGTIGRGRTAADDERLARELLDSTKDRAEHAIGVQETIERLAPFSADVTVEPSPHVLRLSRVQHLETHISTRVAGGTHVLDLLEALHPAAAVCGSPRERALDMLARLEPFDRGWYAGPVGWFDGAGNGLFAPALRSGVRCDGRWRLYAGAGIVAGSEAAREWEETRIKFEPMLRALRAPTAA